MSKSPSLRRIQADIRELARDPSDRYVASPSEDDMFEWHFTIRGADQTEFEGGVYHGRILLPPEYPFKPPHIVFLTPSGRFETGVKICLSFSAFHPELWQPAWGIRLILEALISFLPTPADGAIGSLDWSKEERRRLAKKSQEWCCPKYGRIIDLLPPIGSVSKPSSAKGKFDKEIKKLHAFQIDNEKNENKKKKSSKTKTSSDSQKKVATVANAEEENDGVVVEKLKDETTVFDSREETPTAATATNKNESDHSEQKPLSTTTTTTAFSNNNRAKEHTTETPLETNHHNSTTHANPPPPQLVAANNGTDWLTDSSWISDPIINGSIITVAAIVFLLYRKVESLMEELRSLHV